MKPHRTARYYYLKVIRLKGDPGTLARGVAIGIFIGITPTIPLHTVLILLFASLFRGNTIAGILAGTAVSNPLTFFFQYYFSWRIGDWLIPGKLSWDKIRNVMEVLFSDHGFGQRLTTLGQLGLEAIIVMLVGGFLLALPFTLFGYLASFKFFTAVQKKRRERHLLR